MSENKNRHTAVLELHKTGNLALIRMTGVFTNNTIMMIVSQSRWLFDNISLTGLEVVSFQI